MTSERNMDTVRLCSEAWVVRMGPISGPKLEGFFLCMLPARHDGFHRDPEWGIWQQPVGDNTMFIAERMPDA